MNELGAKIDDVKDIVQARTRLCETITNKSALIVLDDIGNSTQIHELMDVEIFKAKRTNKMIITTRDWHLVENLGDVGRVDLDELIKGEAMKLFSRHAFGDQGYEIPSHMVDIVENIVDACRGLPLSLKVVGGTLYGFKRLRIWVRALRRLQRARSLGLANNNEVWHCLRISFDDLTQEEKNLFLDLCCYFSKDLVPMDTLKVVTSSCLWRDVNKES